MSCLFAKRIFDVFMKTDRNDMNGMPEHDESESVGWKSRLQIYGVLSKRSAGQSKWMKRFQFSHFLVSFQFLGVWFYLNK